MSERTHTLDLEYWDGSTRRETVRDKAEAWAAVDYYDRRQDIKSAWFDEEPWFGDCTRDDIP
jgi:hypothetical protein